MVDRLQRVLEAIYEIEVARAAQAPGEWLPLIGECDLRCELRELLQTSAGEPGA